MTTTFSQYDIAAGALLVRLSAGAGSFVGITAAADGTVGSTLDVTVAAGAYVLLPNGQFFDANNGLVTVALPGNTVNGTGYHLYVDSVFVPATASVGPVFTVATAAPSTSALKIADVTVAGNVVSAVTLAATGLPLVGSGSFNGASTTVAPSAGAGAALPATPQGYLSVTINNVARKIAYY